MRYAIFFVAVLLVGFTAAGRDEIPPPRPVPDRVLQEREWIKRREGHWNRLFEFQAKGMIAKVIPIAEDLVATDRQLLGPDHALVPDSLGKLAVLYRANQDFLKAARASLESAVLYAKRHGPDHWLVKDARHWAAADERAAELTPEQRTRLREAYRAAARARELQDRGKCRDAAPEYKVCVAAFEELLGADSFPVLMRLGDLGVCYDNLGEYNLAREAHERCLTGIAKALGKAHPNYAIALNNLASVMVATGDYERAVGPFKEALAVNRAAHGERHEKCAYNLANLGLAYHKAGNWAGAEPLLAEAVGIFRERLGPNAPEYATALCLLGNVYSSRDQYDRAEVAYREALAVYRAWGRGGHPSTPMALNGLSTVYYAVGDYGRAGRYLEEALAFLRTSLGEKHPNTAVVLNNLARLYDDAGLRERAIATYEQVLAIEKETLGEKHPQYARTLTDLGGAYLRLGKLDRAEAILLRALELQKDGPASRHLNYAFTLGRAAEAAAQQGHFRRAEELVGESVMRRTAVLGADSPTLSQDYWLLAEVFAATGRPEGALDLFRRALELEEQDVRESFGFTTESAMQIRLMFANRTLDALLSFARSRPADSAAQELALTWVLRRKGAVLNALCRFRDLQRAVGAHPEVAEWAVRVRGAFDAYMARLAVPVGADEDAFRAEANKARTEYLQQQADLHRTLERVRPTSALRAEGASLAAVRGALPEGTALVEFTEFTPSDLAALGRGGSYWQPRRCLAFVLTREAGPRLIDLGEVEPIERGVREVRTAFAQFPRFLKSASEKMLDDEFRELAAGVARRVFAPVRAALGDTRSVVLAPDGALNLLPFDALVEDGEYLFESYRIRYVATGRDLLRPAAPRGTGTTVFAGPDFDLGARAAPVPTPSRADGLVLRGVDVVRLRGGLGLRWKALDGADREADDIRDALTGTGYGPVRVATGAAARKDAFTAVRGPRLLHISTHGYFLADRAEEEPLPRAERPERPGLPPLLRSGLVLAGANAALDPKATAAVVGDGLVTAEEVALMDLRGTELVVLSACESGLGNVEQAGEGVFGLRRAFHYAGARSVMVAMFKVSDADTRELMRAFYGQLRKGATPASSLHEAKRELIALRQKVGGAAHPFYWSGFVLIGGEG